MTILEKGEETEYANFMDAIATAVFVESVHNVMELNKTNQDACDNIEEISMAMGQVVLDKVIDLTKDMSREKMLRIFTEMAIGYSVNVMQKHPEYKMRIAILNGMKK